MMFLRSSFWLCLSILVCAAHLVSAGTVTTLPATGFGAGTVTLNGSANPGGTSGFGHFEYGLSTSYGSQTGDQILGGGNSSVNFSQIVTGLTGGKIFHYRADLVILNTGTINGNDQSFFMPGAPVVNALAATSLHPGEATLNATVNANNTNNVSTTYWFQHGTTTNYGGVTSSGTIGSGTNLIAISNLVTGLPRGVTYHFRAVASNIFGVTFGTDMNFSVLPGTTTPGGSTGSGLAFDGRQPALELNFIIATNGIYPSDSFAAAPLLSEICLFSGNFVPAGWAPCNGQLLAISNATALFSLLGTTYGGDGINTFALPNLQGYRPVEAGQGGGLSLWINGQVNGSTQQTLLVQNLPPHTHSLAFPDSFTGTTGSGQPRDNRQPSLAVNYLIALQGIFPSPTNTATTEPYLGEIILYGGENAFRAGTPLDGQTLPINQNPALFALTGTTYGGNGTTTFLLPNLQSRVPIGPGQGQLSQWTIGQQTGADVVFTTTSQVPVHQHTVPATGGVTGFTGGNSPQSIMQPSLVLQYFIATNGAVPSATVATIQTMIGEIQLFAGTNLLGGWLPCDGRLLQISNAPSLFGVISNWFGGNGVTTFALPNLCGRVPVGSTNGQPGAAYGVEQVVLTVSNLPPHTHTGPAPDYDRWVTSFGLSNNAAAFSADADTDHAANGYEWATGSNPTNAPSVGPLTISSTHSNVLVGFPRNTNATDVVFTLQRSTNLNSSVWTSIATNTAGVWTPSAIVSESGSTNPVSVKISDSLTNTRADYRLQITSP